jgi:hypothetical protein
MAYIQLANCIQDEIKSYANMIAKIGTKNDVGLVFDEFKKVASTTTDALFTVDPLAAEYYYLNIGMYSTPSLTATVKSADEVIEALDWFREKGWKSTGFTDDGDSQTRSYTMKNKDSENQFTFEAYFSGGTCEFVPVEGKRKHVKGTAAIAATKGSYVPVMELKCNEFALPTE